MKKLAIFDVDWTLIKPKDGRLFPKDKNDWQWLYNSVPETLIEYSEEYTMVFLTDQTKDWKVTMIKEILDNLDFEYTLICSREKKTNKPNPSLFKKTIRYKFDKEESFYVGDAAGRDDDWSSVDIDVADALSIPFYVPEDIFSVNEEIRYDLEPSDNREIIIMVGYPGSGKSTLAASLPDNYKIISGDIFKTPERMIKEARNYIEDYSIIFDATNGTIEKRKKYINFATENNVEARIVWINVDIDVAIERLSRRVYEGGAKVPKMALYIYRKHFEEPFDHECPVHEYL